MKVSPIPGFGSFGVYIDDIDMDYMTDEQWMEIGKIFIDEMVVVFRNIKMTKDQYVEWVYKWGPSKSDTHTKFVNKYGKNLDAKDPNSWKNLEEEDRIWLEGRKYFLEETESKEKYVTRIYGGKDEEGHALGYFSGGYLGWHSNEGSSLTHTPAVAFYGWDHMEGSATGFVQTVDLYESFSESFRSELDEMVLTHKYVKGVANENEFTDDTLALHIKNVFCPTDGAETPLVCTAPNGRRGLHYPANTRHGIKGMPQEQAGKVFAEIERQMFNGKYVYDHYYSSAGRDLCVFDNSVTLHHRIGNHPERKGFRAQFDVSPIMDKPWLPWEHFPEYHRKYIDEIHNMVNTVGGPLKEHFKLPSKLYNMNIDVKALKNDINEVFKKYGDV